MSSLFSYSAIMAVDLGWSEDRESAGFSAGWLASAVFIGRFFTAGAWGEFADKRGRRPALAITLTSMAIGNLLFGFCKSFWMAIAIRLKCSVSCDDLFPT